MNATEKTLSQIDSNIQAAVEHTTIGKSLDEFPAEDDDRSDIGPIPNVPDPEMEAIIEHIITGKPLDPELLRRVHERSEKATQELFEKHGFLNVAVDLIRECRDE